MGAFFFFGPVWLGSGAPPYCYSTSREAVWKMGFGWVGGWVWIIYMDEGGEVLGCWGVVCASDISINE